MDSTDRAASHTRVPCRVWTPETTRTRTPPRRGFAYQYSIIVIEIGRIEIQELGPRASPQEATWGTAVHGRVQAVAGSNRLKAWIGAG